MANKVSKRRSRKVRKLAELITTATTEARDPVNRNCKLAMKDLLTRTQQNSWSQLQVSRYLPPSKLSNRALQIDAIAWAEYIVTQNEAEDEQEEQDIDLLQFKPPNHEEEGQRQRKRRAAWNNIEDMTRYNSNANRIQPAQSDTDLALAHNSNSNHNNGDSNSQMNGNGNDNLNFAASKCNSNINGNNNTIIYTLEDREECVQWASDAENLCRKVIYHSNNKQAAAELLQLTQRRPVSLKRRRLNNGDSLPVKLGQ